VPLEAVEACRKPIFEKKTGFPGPHQKALNPQPAWIFTTPSRSVAPVDPTTRGLSTSQAVSTSTYPWEHM
jgi:hypothetical protein